MYIWPKLHFPKTYFPEFALAECTFGLNYVFPKIHFPEFTLARMYTFGRNYISPKTYFPEFTLARMYIWPKLHFPKNLFSRIYTCQNLAEITFPQKLIFQNLPLPEFGRNYVSPKTYFPEFTLARMCIWSKLHFPENLYSSSSPVETRQNRPTCKPGKNL